LAQIFPSAEASWHTHRPRVLRALRLAFCAASAGVAALSLAPAAALPPTSIGDKMEHVIAYAVLGLLGTASFAGGAARVILGLAAFGGAIELLQAFSPGRAPDVLDVVADIAGAGLGCGAAIMLRRMTWLLIDKHTTGATPCRACDAGSDAHALRGHPAAAPSSPHKSASCESD